jgi:hypothetical protein
MEHRESFGPTVKRPPVKISTGDMPEEDSRRRLGTIEEQRQMGRKEGAINRAHQCGKTVVHDEFIKDRAIREMKGCGDVHGVVSILPAAS